VRTALFLLLGSSESGQQTQPSPRDVTDSRLLDSDCASGNPGIPAADVTVTSLAGEAGSTGLEGELPAAAAAAAGGGTEDLDVSGTTDLADQTSTNAVDATASSTRVEPAADGDTTVAIALAPCTLQKNIRISTDI